MAYPGAAGVIACCVASWCPGPAGGLPPGPPRFWNPRLAVGHSVLPSGAEESSLLEIGRLERRAGSVGGGDGQWGVGVAVMKLIPGCLSV